MFEMPSFSLFSNISEMPLLIPLIKRIRLVSDPSFHTAKRPLTVLLNFHQRMTIQLDLRVDALPSAR